jgi:hypothetical protein
MKTSALLGLIAAIALAGGAAADPGAPSPAPSSPLPPGAAERALDLEMGLTRLAAFNSFEGFWRAAKPSFRQAAAILAPHSPVESRLWTDFFAHATRTGETHGDTAITGWRDPLTDVWMLGAWSRDGDGWRLDHLTFALTQDLGGQFAPDAPLQPAFPDMKDGLGRALVYGQLRALAAFHRAARTPGAINWDPAAPSAQRSRNVALLRLRAAEDSLAAMAGVDPHAARLLRVALVEETPLTAGVSASVADKLHARSVETRLSLQPVQYIPGQGEVLALVQSAYEPQWVFVTHLAPAGGAGDLKVANVEAIDLSKAEPAP